MNVGCVHCFFGDSVSVGLDLGNGMIDGLALGITNSVDDDENDAGDSCDRNDVSGWTCRQCSSPG